jgi:positive regulator of sigma E activity
MDTPRGTVVSVMTRGDRLVATVDVDVSNVCARCAAGKGCGAGLLIGSGSTRHIEATVGPDLRLAPGDTVEVRLEPRSILHAAFVAYGAPLVGALIAAAIAYGLSLGDVEAASASLVGVAVGMFAGRLYLKRPECLRRFEPTVSSVL